MYILGINGSPEQEGPVTDLLSEAMRAAKLEGQNLSGKAAVINTIRLDALDMPFHNGSLTEVPDQLKGLFEEMRRSDGFIFATPVNWFGASSLMKCFIDWLTSLEDQYELEGKVAGIITHCNCDGGNQAAMSLVAPLLHMGLMIPPYCAFYRNRNVGENSEERWQMTDQVLVGQNVARTIVAMNNHHRGWSIV